MKEDFVKKGKKEMPEFVTKAIKDLLEKLDSKIVIPKNKDGFELENKLFAVVQSREEVYKGICELMDLIDLDQSKDQKFKDKIIQGLKTTWHELTIIATRDIGNIEKFTEDEIIDYESEDHSNLSREEIRTMAYGSVTDDIMTSITKAKVLASKVSFQILDRIALLEDPDAAKEEILKNSQSSNIIENYVEN